MLLEDAERIAQQSVFFIHRSQDRPLIITDDCFQLFIGIFSCSILEQIRTAAVMDHRHLHEQLIDAFHILDLRSSDLHK